MSSHQIRNLVEAMNKDAFSLMTNTFRNKVRMSAHATSIPRGPGDPS